jgi:hypothetical protein
MILLQPRAEVVWWIVLVQVLAGCVATDRPQSASDGRFSDEAGDAGGHEDPAQEDVLEETSVLQVAGRLEGLLDRCAMVSTGGVARLGAPPVPLPDGWEPAATHAHRLDLLHCNRIITANFTRPITLVLETIASGRPDPRCGDAPFVGLLYVIYVSDPDVADALRAVRLPSVPAQFEFADDGKAASWTWQEDNQRYAVSLMLRPSPEYIGGLEMLYFWKPSAGGMSGMRFEIALGGTDTREVPFHTAELGARSLYPGGHLMSGSYWGDANTITFDYREDWPCV